MPPSDPVVPIELLLEAARQRIAETSLREAAAEIGMEHSGLNKLLARGHKPRPSTVRKLTTWYLKRAAAGELEIDVEVVQAALAILVKHLSPAAREGASNQLLRLLAEITAGDGAGMPQWLTPAQPH